MTLKLHSVNIAGNLHDAATAINTWGWAEYLHTLSYVGDYNTIAVFRMPAEKVYELRAQSASYVADVRHDDYRGPVDVYSSHAQPTLPTMTGWPEKEETVGDTIAMSATAGNVAGSEAREAEGVPANLKPVPEHEKTPPVETVVVKPKATKKKPAEEKPAPVANETPPDLSGLPEWAR